MHLVIAILALGGAMLPTASMLPAQQVRPCTSSEWFWDTFVEDLGCGY